MPWEAPSIRNPIQKVLSTLSAHKVRVLLIGGQACVFYGAAEFSRDTDLTLLASDDNLALLRAGLRDLHARRIAVPPFDRQFLLRGHAIHFRCHHPDALNMRIEKGLEQEERLEREADRAYWKPLRREPEDLRRGGDPSEEEV